MNWTDDTSQPLLKILHAHNFPPTALKFNPSANLLISASADNTLRAIVVPASFSGGESPFLPLARGRTVAKDE